MRYTFQEFINTSSVFDLNGGDDSTDLFKTVQKIIKKQDMKLIKDFSGASVGDFSVDGNEIYAGIFEEPSVKVDGIVHDYGLHFCFGVSNDSGKGVSADIYINTDKSRGDLIHDVKIYMAKNPGEEFAYGIIGKTDRKKSYSFLLSLGANETVYVANAYVRQYERVSAIFKELACQGHGEKIIYGRSVEGRELSAYRYGSEIGQDDKPEVFIVSGWHPPEGDTFGTEGIAEILSDDREREELLKSVNITIIPIGNPDGFVHGFNGCNLKLRNVYWDFDINNKDEMPETYFAWKLMGKIKPDIYFDFHGYTFQGESKFLSSYIKPLLFYSSRRRMFAENLNRRIIERCGGKCVKGYSTFAPSTPGCRLTSKFDTITYAKFHFHIDDGISGIKKMACDLLKITIGEIKKTNSSVFHNNTASFLSLHTICCKFYTYIIGYCKIKVNQFVKSILKSLRQQEKSNA